MNNIINILPKEQRLIGEDLNRISNEIIKWYISYCESLDKDKDQERISKAWNIFKIIQSIFKFYSENYYKIHKKYIPLFKL